MVGPFRLEDALDIIAHCNDADFDRALASIMRLQNEREGQREQFREELQEDVRTRLLATIDEIAAEYGLVTLTDGDLPLFFETCSSVADIMLERTRIQTTKEPSK